MITAESGRRTPVRPRRPRALLLATLLLGFLFHPLGQPARAATMFGHDISWPQCPSAVGGYGLPMPPHSTDFVILGLGFTLFTIQTLLAYSAMVWRGDGFNEGLDPWLNRLARLFFHSPLLFSSLIDGGLYGLVGISHCSIRARMSS